MTKVKNIDGFIEAKEIMIHGHEVCPLCKVWGFNQARKEIGELDIPLDVDKIEKLLKDKFRWERFFTDRTPRIVAEVIAKGDILR